MVHRCNLIAQMTEQPGCTTRRFLSPPMRALHRLLRDWMERAGMRVWVDAAGNLRGAYDAADRAGHGAAPRLLIGSHVDTVPCAGAFDGVLGVVLAIALVESLNGARLPYGVEVAAFSEEEGVRFGVPFIGSRALAGSVNSELLGRQDAQGVTVAQAIRDFGLDPDRIEAAAIAGEWIGYFEFHIEQGPALDRLDLPLGIVDAIAGQSRMDVVFRGQANHAGTTPMQFRKDALAAAAEWIASVEREALGTAGLVATVGKIEAFPGAANVIPGETRATLDVRHGSDATRLRAVQNIVGAAHEIARARGIAFEYQDRMNQAAAAMDGPLAQALEDAVARAGYPVHRMVSGAGHDAMILAARMPAAMLFVRSPGGVSHHPDETVRPEDVEAALRVGERFLEGLKAVYA